MLQIASFGFKKSHIDPCFVSAMDREELESWARAFADQQMVGGERVPLDRLIKHHITTFTALRAQGLTWRSIAAILSRAGLRRKDGSPVSPDQLRADFSRLSARQTRAATSSRRKMSGVSSTITDQPRSAIVQSQPPEVTTIKNNPAERAPSTTFEVPDKSVSSDDVAAALARIRKL